MITHILIKGASKVHSLGYFYGYPSIKQIKDLDIQELSDSKIKTLLKENKLIIGNDIIYIEEIEPKIGDSIIAY